MVKPARPMTIATSETPAARPRATRTAPTAKRRASAAPGDEVETTGAKKPGPKTAPVKAASVKAPSGKGSSAKGSSAKTAAPQTVAAKTDIGKAGGTRPRAAKAMSSTSPASKKPPARGASSVTAGAEARAAAPKLDFGYLDAFVGFHLRLAQDASYRAFSRHKDKDLVKPGRFPALAIIQLNPGISQSALGRAIARDKSTVSPLIKDLQKNGLISRKPSPHDRRSVTLVLTKKGERTLERLRARAAEHEVELETLIGSSKQRLVGLLGKITAGLAV